MVIVMVLAVIAVLVFVAAGIIVFRRMRENLAVKPTPSDPEQEPVRGVLELTDAPYEADNGDMAEMPYEVRHTLREYVKFDPEKGIGGYGRYTEISLQEDAPGTMRKTVSEANARAKESVISRVDALMEENDFPVREPGGRVTEDIRYAQYSYILTVTRADDALFGILETDMQKNVPDYDPISGYVWGEGETHCIFRAASYDTETGKELALADLSSDTAALSDRLSLALKQKYGVTDFADTAAADAFVWTADYLGVRFYFQRDKVDAKKWEEVNAYFSQNNTRTVHVSLPYCFFDGAYKEKASRVPESFIAQIDRGYAYALPYEKKTVGVEVLEDDKPYAVTFTDRKGRKSTWVLDYGDAMDDYFLLRAEGKYCFIRQVSEREAFCYNFDHPDGGYGRFQNQGIQYFSSFLGECQLALPFSPACAYMCEEQHRSFGEDWSDQRRGTAGGHYAFLTEPGRGVLWTHFVLKDDALFLDMENVALRLLQDIRVTELDAAGHETGDYMMEKGDLLMPYRVQGEAKAYFYYAKDYQMYEGVRDFVYDCTTGSGKHVRLYTRGENDPYYDGIYLSRITEASTKGEAEFPPLPVEEKQTLVRIRDTYYPLIPDPSARSHLYENIDFGGENWWDVMGYTGTWEMTKADLEESERLDEGVTTARLVIGVDGSVTLDVGEEHYEGQLPVETGYSTVTEIEMDGPRKNGNMRLIRMETEKATDDLRDEVWNERGNDMEDIVAMIPAFDRVSCHFAGLPATNEPSKEHPMEVYLTRSR